MSGKPHSSNMEGINDALSLIEKKIAYLEKTTREKTERRIRESPTRNDQEEVKPKRLKREKTVGVLLKKSRTEHRTKLQNLTREEKGQTKRDSKEPGLSKRRREKASGDKECHYANPTKSVLLKQKLREKGELDKEKRTVLPFVTEAGQNKSHNLNVIIQQTIAQHRYLLPAKPAKPDEESQELRREDIGDALSNIEKNMKVIEDFAISSCMR